METLSISLSNQQRESILDAVLSKSDENKYTANTEDGKVYFLNQAAVSFYLGNPGDELYVIVNENGEGNFAAIEAIIKK